MDVGNAVVPSMVQVFLEKDLSKLPTIDECESSAKVGQF